MSLRVATEAPSKEGVWGRVQSGNAAEGRGMMTGKSKKNGSILTQV